MIPSDPSVRLNGYPKRDRIIAHDMQPCSGLHDEHWVGPFTDYTK